MLFVLFHHWTTNTLTNNCEIYFSHMRSHCFDVELCMQKNCYLLFAHLQVIIEFDPYKSMQKQKNSQLRAVFSSNFF